METKKEPLKLLQLQLLRKWTSKNSGQVCDSADRHSFARILIGDHDFREYMMRKHMPLEADDICVDKLNKGWFGDDIDAFHEAVII